MSMFNYSYAVRSDKKDENGKVQTVGTVAVSIPLLSAFGIEAVAKVGEDGKPVFDESGVPEYMSQEHNFLQRSILNSCMIKVRVMLQKNSVELKPGKKLPETLAEYLDVSSDRGAARREKGEALKLFAAWILEKGKPQKVVEYLTGAVANADSFKTQPEDKRALVANAVVTFLTEAAEKLSAFQTNYLADTAEVIQKGEVIEDDELAF